MDRFPLLSASDGAFSALAEIARHKAKGAVFNANGRHELVTWEDLAALAKHNQNAPLLKASSHPVDVSEFFAHGVVQLMMSPKIEGILGRLTTIEARPCVNDHTRSCTCDNVEDCKR
jgi:hypothetical protein